MEAEDTVKDQTVNGVTIPWYFEWNPSLPAPSSGRAAIPLCCFSVGLSATPESADMLTTSVAHGPATQVKAWWNFQSSWHQHCHCHQR